MKKTCWYCWDTENNKLMFFKNTQKGTKVNIFKYSFIYFEEYVARISAPVNACGSLLF